jgi:hypothetical protein
VPQPRPTLAEVVADHWELAWDGVSQRTYFIQTSVNLHGWEYQPVMAFGDGLWTTLLGSTSQRYFVRLVHADTDSIGTLQQAKDADFDYDGIPNWFEVETLGSDPFDPSSNGGDVDSDGLPDGWELYWFGSLFQGPQDVNPHTGLTHLQSHAEGRNPNAAAVPENSSATHVGLVVFTAID